MRAIDRWRQLTRVEKTLVVRAAAAVATMALGVRAFGLKRMLRMPAVDRAGRSRTEPAHVAELVAAVDRAGRYVPGGSCLAQSLALARMLRKRGVPADVRVGVRTDAGFHAHAWVDVDGTAVTSESGHEALTHRSSALGH